MGVFDYIRCQMPLPSEPAPPKGEWMQTKDTPEQYLERYTITFDGRLVWHKIERDFDSITKENIEIKDFHGDLCFGDFSTKTREAWDYIARFTEGRCVRVWLERYEVIAAPHPGDAS